MAGAEAGRAAVSLDSFVAERQLILKYTLPSRRKR